MDLCENTENTEGNVVPEIASSENVALKTTPSETTVPEVVACENIPPELSITHPLQNRWVLWYLKGDKAKSWETCLKNVSVFNTVEDFWALFNHIQQASNLSYGSDYYLFKEGIKPMWEDPENVKGGRWLVVIDRKRAKLDHYWLELMMAVIGEQFEDCGDEICGAAVNVRNKNDKVALWTRDAGQIDKITHIGHIIKEKLDIPESESVVYEVHNDSKERISSNIKARFKL